MDILVLYPYMKKKSTKNLPPNQQGISLPLADMFKLEVKFPLSSDSFLSMFKLAKTVSGYVYLR